MRAVYFETFGGSIEVADLPDPKPSSDGAVIQVMTTGLCRSDWHGWMGHDPDIRLPHVPGHEFAGIIKSVGRDVSQFSAGDRVTVPFIAGCGTCQPCQAGDQQVCDRQSQPGFTHWGSFAELVAIDRADLNLVRLPDSLSFDTAASLGCRFATAFRGLIDQGQLKSGQWVAVFGCGGVGLSAISIAVASGARVIAVDLNTDALKLAKSLGASAVLNPDAVDSLVDEIRELTQGGAHIGIDALGHTVTCVQSILSLRKRGKHIQVGLMLADHAMPSIPMGPIVANELEIYGSHGIQAHRYDAMLALIEAGKVVPEQMVTRRITLDQVPEALASMDQSSVAGITLIHPSVDQ